jgi:hypothetical protein
MGYLANKKPPTLLGTPRTLGIGLRQGPRGVRFHRLHQGSLSTSGDEGSYVRPMGFRVT